MLWLDLKRTRGVTLSRQLYDQLVARILAGELPGGARLPSSRQLAADHKIARNLVIAVYEQLLAEGFLEAREGSGTFVSRLEHLDVLARECPEPAPERATAPDRPEPVSFVCGTPDLARFPRAQWLSCLRQVAFFREPAMWGYAPPAGSPALRIEIAGHLLRMKGHRCAPEQVIVTAGSAQALLLAGLLVAARRPGALVEDPVVSFVPEILRRSGHSVSAVRADSGGICVDELPARPRAGLVFVSPSHQFPLGGTMPVQRRLALLEYARRWGLLVVEDDYDSEFRYSGAPVSALCRLAPEGVIHLGTFSKSLTPALRLGYAVLPGDRIAEAEAIVTAMHLSGSRYAQEALARFMHLGHLDRHIVRMQRAYHRKMKTLQGALRTHFGDRVAISGHTTGLHLVATFKGVRFNAARRAHIAQHGVQVDAVDDFAMGRPRHPGALAMGFGHLSFSQIEAGVRRLAAALATRAT